MDGDSPNIAVIAQICKDHGANLIVLEAHAIGIFGLGIVHNSGLQNAVFANVITYGKATGK